MSKRVNRGYAFCLVLAGLYCAGPALGQAESQALRVVQDEDGIIRAEGQEFATWADYAKSAFFANNAGRCGTAFQAPNGPVPQGGGPADCTASFTNPTADYDPSVVKYRIPVVVHVIRQSNGVTGNISEAMVHSAIDILNEDFLALPGTNGGNGNDSQIEFYLATEDPNGQPTNGITYSNNTTWYNDGGGYYNTLAWDTNRYMNVYTNTASGNLGYVPALPQNGIVGSKSDRVVVLWSSFGLNAPIGHPFNLGRTFTHEVGHYLGLHHTFSGGCGSATSCYTTADRICDTNPESSPTPNYQGCINRNTCGYADPFDNYMDYTDDFCMEQFTPEQVRRMRCTLEFYRSNLFELGDQCGNGVLDPGETCDTAIAAGMPDACPTVCDSGDVCISGTVLEPGTCLAECSFTPIVDAIDNDGCCPPGENANTDNDCVAQCGNAACEPGEDEVSCPADCDCTTIAQCDPGDVCTYNDCQIGQCVNLPRPYGNIDGQGLVDIFDILCMLDAFSGSGSHPCATASPDISPCETNGDGSVDIFDILAVLDAFAGSTGCCAP